MYIMAVGSLVVGVLGSILVLIFWLLRKHINKHPKLTITITMAGLIFAISLGTIAKTYLDYKEFLELGNVPSRLISNVVFALFLDFTVLIIGGLFLYIANQLYLSDILKDTDNNIAPPQAKPSE